MVETPEAVNERVSVELSVPVNWKDVPAAFVALTVSGLGTIGIWAARTDEPAIRKAHGRQNAHRRKNFENIKILRGKLELPQREFSGENIEGCFCMAGHTIYKIWERGVIHHPLFKSD